MKPFKRSRWRGETGAGARGAVSEGAPSSGVLLEEGAAPTDAQYTSDMPVLRPWRPMGHPSESGNVTVRNTQDDCQVS